MRGDIPQGYEKPQGEYYTYASDLVSHIKEYGYFDIGGACYPECHPECESLEKDIDHLKIKVDCVKAGDFGWVFYNRIIRNRLY